MVLRRLGKSIHSAIEKFVRRGPLDKELVLELKNDIFRALLDADIDIAVASVVVNNLEQRSLTEELPPGIDRKKAVINIVYEELTRIMGGEARPLNVNKKKTNIIMMLGSQGSGKTTTVGKLAYKLKKEGWRVGLVAADTWRPGAYDQLVQLGERAEVEVFGNPKQKNAVKIAQEGIKHFRNQQKNLIIVDTAGRHKGDDALIKEMKNLTKKIKPDEVIFVVDGTNGKQVFESAQKYARVSEIGSIIVTKLDGTAKGGGAISASAAAGVPIKYIGTGEDITALEEFNPKKFVGRILGMGDLDTLIEEVKKANLALSEDRTEEMMKGHMNYNDILMMFESMNKMGGFRKILDMLPGGMTHQVDDNMLNMSKENMEKFKVVISSMTKKEREAEVKLNRTRIERIARGSGVTVEDVKELVNQKKMAEKMVKQMNKPKRRGRGGSGGGLPFGLPFG